MTEPGSPAWGQKPTNTPNTPPFGQPPVGPPPTGQPQYGESPYGQAPQYGDNPYGQPQPQYGQAPYGQQSYGQPQYGQQPYGQPQPSKGLAVTSLVLGLIALLLSWLVFPAVLGLIAVVLGFVAVAKASKGTAGGRGMAIGGIITGVLSMIVAGLILAATVWFFNEVGESSFGDLTSCLIEAGEDQAAIDKCNADFTSQIEDQFGIPPTP